MTVSADDADGRRLRIGRNAIHLRNLRNLRTNTILPRQTVKPFLKNASGVLSRLLLGELGFGGPPELLQFL